MESNQYSMKNSKTNIKMEYFSTFVEFVGKFKEKNEIKHKSLAQKSKTHPSQFSSVEEFVALSEEKWYKCSKNSI